ncbi:MAG: phytanoyl-CoA dioxygenase family protein [Aureliella sp.]
MLRRISRVSFGRPHCVVVRDHYKDRSRSRVDWLGGLYEADPFQGKFYGSVVRTSDEKLTIMDPGWSKRFQHSGFGIVPNLLPEEVLTPLSEEFDALIQSQQSGVLVSRGVAYGIRNVLDLLPDLARSLRSTSMVALASELCGEEAGLVRALFFDKPPERSWTLPWHRDRAIAVRESIANLPSGFSNPTCKSGIPHVNASKSLLEEMVTIRISIDAMHSDNGPLVVLPGSHSTSREEDGDLCVVNPDGIHVVHCRAGDAFVMRPLLAHSSVKSTAGCVDRRRVLHLEFSGQPNLPGGLEWRHYIPIS